MRGSLARRRAADTRANDRPAFIQRADLATIWRQSDAISPHCPLTPENRAMGDACVDVGVEAARNLLAVLEPAAAQAA